jgi:hypothetical protein
MQILQAGCDKGLLPGLEDTVRYLLQAGQGMLLYGFRIDSVLLVSNLTVQDPLGTPCVGMIVQGYPSRTVQAYQTSLQGRSVDQGIPDPGLLVLR